MTLVHLKFTLSTGNLWGEVSFLHWQSGLLGLSLSCPGSTRRGCVSDKISQTDGERHCGKDCRKCYRMAMTWECGSAKTYMGTGWYGVCGTWTCQPWAICLFWGFWYHRMNGVSSCTVYTELCSECDHHKHSMTSLSWAFVWEWE